MLNPDQEAKADQRPALQALPGQESANRARQTLLVPVAEDRSAAGIARLLRTVQFALPLMNSDERFSPVVEVTRQAFQFKVSHFGTVHRPYDLTPIRQPLAHVVVVRAGCVVLGAGAACVDVVPGALSDTCPPPHPVRKTATASATSIQFRVMQPRPLVWPRIACQGGRQMVSGPGRGGRPRAAHDCAVQPPQEKRISRFSRYSRNAGSCP